ncbi:MAG: hypothetical protein KME67_05140 [Candidatus Thiodiazotropha sp. (ex Codakia orbicularis)]|nr:hypothetical protein [Candidatus Thiodiazotropha sp. (ex Codakia orbicularis)]
MTDEKKQAPVIAYKGFDKDMKCRGFQYEIGETYTYEGSVEACRSGFHSCEYPLDVFSYYPPAESVFAVVEADGNQDRHEGDSKIASEKITIKAALDLPGLIKAAIEYTTERVKPSDDPAASNSGDYGAASNSGVQGAASNSGVQGAASNSGDYGAASNSGDYGAASNSGVQGAASNSGVQGAASNSGDYGAASNSGEHGVAASFGYQGLAKSDTSGAIVLCHRNDDGEIIHIRASKVGENGIKPDTWYELDADGEFVEVES